MQALTDNPLTLCPAVQFHRSGGQLIIRRHHENNLSEGAVDDCTLGHGEYIVATCTAELHPHKLARPKVALRVGDLRAGFDIASLSVHLFARKVKLAHARKGTPIGQLELYGKSEAAITRALAGDRELPISHLLIKL